MSKEYRWKFPLIAIIVVWAIISAFPLDEKINKGIDLKGGSELLYRVSLDEVDKTIKEIDVKTAAMADGAERSMLIDNRMNLQEQKNKEIDYGKV